MRSSLIFSARQLRQLTPAGWALATAGLAPIEAMRRRAEQLSLSDSDRHLPLPSARDEIYRQSEELEREAVEAIPDGSYRAEGFLDDDGLGHGPLQPPGVLAFEHGRLAAQALVG